MQHRKIVFDLQFRWNAVGGHWNSLFMNDETNMKPHMLYTFACVSVQFTAQS